MCACGKALRAEPRRYHDDRDISATGKNARIFLNWG